ncbi:hypothetical protein [Glaciibacter superstes]|uniref:hypothetical protein n=1 Tax=Glaciibacter superstes TaxID=501023 RepID=UPI0003B51B29|nr:hypothetical protein [Glaciibacter superstes]
MKGAALSNVLKAAFLISAALSLSACTVTTACSAVGYIYSGPAILEFSENLPGDATVSACFAEDCDPEVVDRGEGARWEVPQVAPYVASDFLGIGEERTLRVAVTRADGTVLADEEHEIPIAVERTGMFGQCPGPFEFEAVRVSLAN